MPWDFSYKKRHWNCHAQKTYITEKIADNKVDVCVQFHCEYFHALLWLFASVEKGFDGSGHHRRKANFLIEEVFVNRKMDFLKVGILTWSIFFWIDLIKVAYQNVICFHEL
jgi:hypothetical protein